MSEPKPDWEAIATELSGRVLFAINNLKSTGGVLMSSGGVLKPWRQHFADSLNKIPGVTVELTQPKKKGGRK